MSLKERARQVAIVTEDDADSEESHVKVIDHEATADNIELVLREVHDAAVEQCARLLETRGLYGAGSLLRTLKGRT